VSGEAVPVEIVPGFNEELAGGGVEEGGNSVAGEQVTHVGADVVVHGSAAAAAAKGWWPPAGGSGEVDGALPIVDADDSPPSASEDQAQSDVEREVDGQDSQLAAAGEKPVLLGALERRVEAVAVDGPLPHFAEQQRPILALIDHFAVGE
jgi:hypothetical protein